MSPPIGPSYSISHQQNQSKSSVPTTTTTTGKQLVPKSSVSQHANFWDAYEYQCVLQNQAPLQFLKQSLSVDAGTNLFIDADKIKESEWDPLLAALSVNKNLKSIRIESRYFATPNDKETKDHSLALVKFKKPPSIRSREKTNKVCRSLRDCLTVTTALSRLEIYNIPLSVRDCVQIGKGLRGNKSLRSLSLDSCLIGDEGLIAICQEIQLTSNLTNLDLTSCQLSPVSAQTLCDFVESQSFKRHTEAWKDSLRYGRPDLDTMHGLRRLTLNRNMLIGDSGAKSLSKALESDLWLKALDLQQCGMSNEGAKCFLEALKRGANSSLYILDLRLNDGIDKQTVKSVMEVVMANGTAGSNEYEWMELGGGESGGNKKRPKTAPTKGAFKRPGSSSGKSTQRLSVDRSNTTSAKMKRSKSAGSLAHHQRTSKSSPERGIPWRTAARAAKSSTATTTTTTTRPSMTSRRSNARNDELIETIIDNLTSSEFMTASATARPTSSKSTRSRHESDYFDSNNFLRDQKTADKSSSMKELLIILRKEQETKSRLEDMLIKLQEENTQLKSEINILRSNKPHSTIPNRRLIDDEKALDIIELTLNKYQQFLDFLRTSGYGNLIDIGDRKSSGVYSSSSAKSRSSMIKARKSFKSPSTIGENKSSKRRSSRPINNEELAEFNIKNRILLSNQVDTDDGQNYNIDSLLSNALEISRSYRKINTSSNANKLSNKEKRRQQQEKSESSDVQELSPRRKDAREEIVVNDESPSRKLSLKKQQQDDNQKQPAKLQPLQIQTVISGGGTGAQTTPASSSPATTVIANERHQQQPPPVTARSSRSSSKKSEAEQPMGVEDLSQILSDIDDEDNDGEEEEEEEEEQTTTKSGSQRRSARRDKDDDDDQF